MGDSDRCCSGRFIGVADLAAVRFSLPSQLLEPTPNLEYWNYLDAPNTFVAIGTADDPLDRMLEVLRFWFTKDLKYAKGRPCKPYNSCLGEFFRCNWEAEDNAPKISHHDLGTPKDSAPGSSASSFKSAKLAVAAELGSGGSKTASTVSVSQTGTNPDNPTVRVSYLTEQTSHHPPVSAFYISCPERGLHARGFDQISAKFTGTSIKVTPGEHNLGIFITLEKRDHETYQLTHPAAHLGGILRGALSVTVGDVAFISCPQTKLKAILNYFDEGWLGRSTNKVEGIIFRYDPDNDDKVRIKDVPEGDILVRLGGAWKEKVVFTMGPKPVVSRSPLRSVRWRFAGHGEPSTLAWLTIAGVAPPRRPDYHHRHHTAHGSAQVAPARRATARERVVTAVGRRDQGHPSQAVLQGHDRQAGARREPTREGPGEGAHRRRVEARLLCASYE